MRGCRGGVSPCAGPGIPERTRKSMSFRADAFIRNGNGIFRTLQGIAPAEKGQGAMPLARCRGRAPAQVWAAAQAQHQSAGKRNRRNQSFRTGCPAFRDGNGRFAQPQENDLFWHAMRPARGWASSDLAALGHLPQGGRPPLHPPEHCKSAALTMMMSAAPSFIGRKPPACGSGYPSWIPNRCAAAAPAAFPPPCSR